MHMNTKTNRRRLALGATTAMSAERPKALKVSVVNCRHCELFCCCCDFVDCLSLSHPSTHPPLYVRVYVRVHIHTSELMICRTLPLLITRYFTTALGFDPVLWLCTRAYARACLRVSVPKKDNFGKCDAFVTVAFEGMSFQTRVIEKNYNPDFNEDFM